MRTYSLLYDSVLSFHMLPIEEINAHKSVLVLVFTTLSSRKSAEKILREVSLFFPQAHVAGLSVSAVADGGHILESGTFLQILAFDTAKVSVTAL
ncbi:FIST N-terminal domain-containing protein, partial [Hydrogenimonas sp.]